MNLHFCFYISFNLVCTLSVIKLFHTRQIYLRFISISFLHRSLVFLVVYFLEVSILNILNKS